LPSSLSTSNPFACAYSARPPVSVYGTVRQWGTVVFSRLEVGPFYASRSFTGAVLTVLRTPSFIGPDNYSITATQLTPEFRGGLFRPIAPPSPGNIHRRSGDEEPGTTAGSVDTGLVRLSLYPVYLHPRRLRRCSNDPGLCPIPSVGTKRPESLGLNHPEMPNRAPETLGLRRQGFKPYKTLLMPAFSPLGPPGGLTSPLPRQPERSATNGGWRHHSTTSALHIIPGSHLGE